MKQLLFDLRGLVPALFMPLQLSLILIALGLLRRSRPAILGGAILLYVASLPAVSDSIRLRLENQYPRIPAAQCPAADAVVVLSGFVEPNLLHPEDLRWAESAGRFEEGLKLIRDRKAPVLLLNQPPLMGELLRQAAVEQGIPADAVRLTRGTANTAEEAEAVRDSLASLPSRRVILVTSAIHMGRAAMAFRHAGIEFIAFPVDFRSDGLEWKLGSFLPSPRALALNQDNLHEIYGDLVYRLILH